MAKETVAGVFKERDQGQKAVQLLEREGFSEREVSLVGRDGAGREQGGRGGLGATVADGTTWGAGTGATVGLLAALGTIAIPGIGPLVALGPLAATLGGAAVGGLGGALVDMGIPTEQGRQLENEVKGGKFLVLVESNRPDQAEKKLQEAGAESIRHS